MKRKWWLVPVVLALIGVVWILASDQARLEPLRTAIGLRPVSGERAKSKPICDPIANPNVAVPTDCIPQYIANLPPDPGLVGKLTIEGIDSDNDGVRDDVQRYIAQRWGESERAVKALHLVAKDAQKQVALGDSVSRDQAYEIAKTMSPTSICYVDTVGANALQGQARQNVTAEVTNTPERLERWLKFELLTTNRVYPMSDATLIDACGYDPAALPN